MGSEMCIRDRISTVPMLGIHVRGSLWRVSDGSGRGTSNYSQLARKLSNSTGNSSRCIKGFFVPIICLGNIGNVLVITSYRRMCLSTDSLAWKSIGAGRFEVTFLLTTVTTFVEHKGDYDETRDPTSIDWRKHGPLARCGRYRCALCGTIPKPRPIRQCTNIDCFVDVLDLSLIHI